MYVEVAQTAAGPTGTRTDSVAGLVLSFGGNAVQGQELVEAVIARAPDVLRALCVAII